MANNNAVDAVIASEAIKQVQALKTELVAADAELLKLSQTAVKASKSISSISTPSGLENSASENAKLNAELEKRNAIIAKLHEQIAKKAEQSRLAEIKLQQAREKAFDSYEKTSKREALIAEKNANSYNKTQNQINNLTKVYNDLAIRKERYNNLSANEEMRLNTLAKVTEKYNGILKATDATIGKNQRNVGNYASGYNALGNAVNQLTREMPAGVNSINTLFMAWSNNFPALFDALKGIKEQNKALAAEGKATVSPMKQLSGAFFSLQTLLSAGVTLLTLYGGQFVKWVIEVTKGKESISDLKLRIQALNKAFEEGSVKQAVSNVNELAINIGLAKKGFLDKEKVVRQYNETIGKTTGLVTSVDEAEKALVKNGDAYIKMILYKAAANMALEEATKATLEAEKSRRKSLEEFKSTFEETNLNVGGAGGLGTGAFNAQEYEKDKKRRIEAQKNRRNEEVKINEEAANKNINIAKKFQEDAAKISKNMNFDFFGGTQNEKPVKEKSTRAERAKIEAQALKSVADTISQINQQLDNLRTTAITGSESERAQANKDIEDLIELKKKLNALPTASTTILQPAKKEDVENMRALSAEAKAYMETFTQDFIGQSGFTNTFKILNDEIDGFGENASVTFNAIAESAQEMFNFIANASQQNFDAEYSRLENQKDIALKFAGDSTSGKKKIEDEYEKKRKEIQNRENKAKQKQAIFNIAIDTAQAIIASFIRDPTGITAAVIGAIGAAQIAVVAAQKIPQYFDGTDNHQGGLMLVNDGKGANYREKIILPSGKQIIPEGRNILMDAPKGTRVLNHEQQIQEMLNERGISMSMATKVNNGMTSQEMDAVIGKHFSKIQTNHTVFDKKGISQWSTYNGNKTIRNENLANGIGFRV